MVQNEPDDKQEEPGLQLFTLAYNPVTNAITFRTDMPIPQVMGLVQAILLAQQRAQAREEVLAELAKKEEGGELAEPEGETNG